MRSGERSAGRVLQKSTGQDLFSKAERLHRRNRCRDSESGAKPGWTEIRRCVAFLLRGTFLGHWIAKLFGNQPAAHVNDLMHTQHKWICSELAAYCMEGQPQYADKGVLANHVDAIDPQGLFEDNVIFEPWNDQ